MSREIAYFEWPQVEGGTIWDKPEWEEKGRLSAAGDLPIMEKDAEPGA